jgi:nucleotide-binding universal stress UspA family protein
MLNRYEQEVNMKILVPVEDSPESKKAAEHALSMAMTDRSSVTFLSVIPQDCNPGISDLGISQKEYVSLQGELINIRMANTQKMLDGFVASLRCGDLEIDLLISVGFPCSKIISTAKRGHYDLIVVGHRDVNIFRRIFSASVTNKIVSNAPCSVLVVKS